MRVPSDCVCPAGAWSRGIRQVSNSDGNVCTTDVDVQTQAFPPPSEELALRVSFRTETALPSGETEPSEDHEYDDYDDNPADYSQSRPSLCSVSIVAKKASYDIRVSPIIAKPRFFIMSENEIKGKGRQVKGKVREEVGKMTHNKTEQVKGKIEQAQGKARENLGKAQRRARKD